MTVRARDDRSTAGDGLALRLDIMTPEARSYAFDGLARHLIAAHRLDRLELVLGDLEFLAARCAAGGLDRAILDYDASRVARGGDWQEEAAPAQFARFLTERSHFLRLEPARLLQEAFNSDQERVRRSAATAHSLGRFPAGPWLRKVTGGLEEHHSGQVISMAFWDDRHLAVSTTAREVWVWDCSSGRVERRCAVAPAPAKSLAVSPDGERIAAGYGLAVPAPQLGGVVVWSRTGHVAWACALDEWVHTVRWRSDTAIVAGGGLPSGTEAVGTLWQIDVSTSTITELGNWLADRPILLTWDPRPGRPEHLMALSHDGAVLHLEPGYRAISREEAQELSLQLMADGDYGAHDARLEARRPIAHRICAPTADESGYLSVAAMLESPDRLGVLGEPPVPPERSMFHRPVPDGLYILDLSDGRLGRLPFDKEVTEAGFMALCIAASPDGGRVALGTADGAVHMLDVSDGSPTGSQMVHRGPAPVTSLCFSANGLRVAVGDADSGISVYGLPDGAREFHRGGWARTVAARIDGDEHVALLDDRLELSEGSGRRTIALEASDDGVAAVDLARWGDLALVLCGKRDGERGRDPGQILKLVDLREGRVLVDAPVPTVTGRSRSGGWEGNARHEFTRVRLDASRGTCEVFLGAVDGITAFPLLAHDRHRQFLLPEETTRRDRTMTMLRMGMDEPDLACGVFAVSASGEMLLGGYADNLAHPRITGELHCWHARKMRHAGVSTFASAITAIMPVDGGIVLVGTEDGAAVALRRNGTGWCRLAELEHPVAMACLASDAAGRLACSIARNGLMTLWDVCDGTISMATSIDTEPLDVAFAPNGRRLMVVDVTGQSHVWAIENGPSQDTTGARPETRSTGAMRDRAAGARDYLLAAEGLGQAVEASTRGDAARARALLRDLPEVPQRSDIQRAWQSVLEPA